MWQWKELLSVVVCISTAMSLPVDDEAQAVDLGPDALPPDCVQERLHVEQEVLPSKGTSKNVLGLERDDLH